MSSCAMQPEHRVFFDAELIGRYERNGPRYTSYPTAVEFHPGCSTAQYRQAATRSNQPAGKPLSIYVHIPFCTSPCFYCGCNRVITRDTTRADVYLQYLFLEMAMHAPLFDRTRVAEQLHLGGGTPTFLSLDQLERLMTELHRQFNLSTDASQREFSIEIDPRTLKPETLPALARLGFNRISLGVQDFDAEVQAAVNRVQSLAQTLQAIEQAHTLGFRSVSVDLIYGLPLQTPEKFLRTLDLVVHARPDRIAVYGYAHMPRIFKAQSHIREAQLPSAAERLDLLELTINRLTRAGYVYIGMDHFALPDDELVRAQQQRTLHRNFQGYSTHAECDLIGLGVSAIGKVAGAYAQNAKTLPEYYAALTAGQLPIERGLTMDRDDRLRHAVIQEIMCHGELRFAELSAALGIEFQRYFAAELESLRRLQQDGLIELDGQQLRINPRGRLLLRHVAMEFDAYLDRTAARPFSRAI